SDPILTQHFDTNEIAFTEIDKEIKVLKKRVRALHAYRNTFTPVYRLPPEILARIFSFTRYHARTRRIIYYDKPKPLSWIAVTHISQHWRNIALASPNLWSRISSSYPERIFNEWFRRSKSAALSVHLYKIYPQDARFLGESFFRIQELNLKMGSSSVTTLESSLSSPAPLLESLSISIATLESLSEDWVDDLDGVRLSANLFEGTTPLLRHLELKRCSIDISASLFTGLTVLQLRDPPQKLSATDLLGILRRCPRLTSLTLLDVLCHGAALAPSSICTIALPSLKSLSIEGHSFVQDLDILSHLSFPADSTLRFQSSSDTRGALTVLTDFLNAHKAASRQTSGSTITPSTAPLDLTLECSSKELRLYLITKGSRSLRGRNLIKFEVGGAWTSTLEIPNAPDIFSYLPLSDLASFRTNFNFDARAWTSVFGHLPKLEHISAIGNHAVNLLSVLIAGFDAECLSGREKEKRRGTGGAGRGQLAQIAPTSNTQRGNLVFPALNYLSLEKVAFPERRESLIPALLARKRAGKGLSILKISRCPDFEDIIERLQDVAGYVSWDGWDEWGELDDGPEENESDRDSDAFEEEEDGYVYMI
ncbi:hypothetical protein BDN72DRAFT_843445, partial [Pluteus cervinus]